MSKPLGYEKENSVNFVSKNFMNNYVVFKCYFKFSIWSIKKKFIYCGNLLPTIVVRKFCPFSGWGGERCNVSDQLKSAERKHFP